MRNRIKPQNVTLDQQEVFGKSQQVGKAYLLRIDPDRLLAPIYEGVGKTTSNKEYGGWESRQIKGHSLGHYLSAVAQMYAATKELCMKEKMDYVVDQLADLQRVDGYLAGFESDAFDKAFAGELDVEAFSLNKHWVPWYSIHKIYAGLLDAYTIGGNEKALVVLVKLSDWAYEGTKSMTDQAFQRMLVCEHGGMCETMGALYQITQDEKYLYLANRFMHQAIVEPLGRMQDELQGKHANTQIPKVLGAAKLYEITQEDYYKDRAWFFFETVVTNRSFVIGGNSNSEHFGPSNTEILSRDAAETCNTYNMMKLAEYLFAWTKDVRYMDYYERALYNHILASQEPITGAKTYFISTYPGHFKVYGTDEGAFWCCTGTGMENPARYNRQIYFMEDNNLYVNLFIASTLKIEKKGIKLVQETSFPSNNKVVLRLKEVGQQPLKLNIRIPYWAEEQVIIKTKDRIYQTNKKGYLTLEEEWEDGDVVEITLPIEVWQYSSMDDANKIAIMYGPLVLAGQLGRENFPEWDIVDDHLSLMKYPGINVPVIVSDTKDISMYVVQKDSLIFEIKGIGEPGQQDIILKPFYMTHHERYTIYWKKFTKEEYLIRDKESKLRQEILDECTIDYVQPGNQQSEIEHDYKGNNAESGYLAEVDKSYREAWHQEGFISYRMEVQKDIGNILNVTYYGMEDAHNRSFDLFIDETLIATEDIQFMGKAELVDKAYTIPQELIESIEADNTGKNKICVVFKGKHDHWVVGKILEVRICYGIKNQK